MGALIWLNRHYTVALNNPNVIRLKACLMLSVQEWFIWVHMLEKRMKNKQIEEKNLNVF